MRVQFLKSPWVLNEALASLEIKNEKIQASFAENR